MKINKCNWTGGSGMQWHTWDEYCDVCGKHYRKSASFQSSNAPDASKDVCLECMRKYIDENRRDELRDLLNSK